MRTMLALTWASLALLASATPAQIPLKAPSTMNSKSKAFTPKELLELERPGVGAPNPTGDLALIGVSKYSFEHDKYVLLTCFRQTGVCLNLENVL